MCTEFQFALFRYNAIQTILVIPVYYNFVLRNSCSCRLTDKVNSHYIVLIWATLTSEAEFKNQGAT
jgi:hypothetical protein